MSLVARPLPPPTHNKRRDNTNRICGGVEWSDEKSLIAPEIVRSTDWPTKGEVDELRQEMMEHTTSQIDSENFNLNRRRVG